MKRIDNEKSGIIDENKNNGAVGDNVECKRYKESGTDNEKVDNKRYKESRAVDCNKNNGTDSRCVTGKINGYYKINGSGKRKKLLIICSFLLFFVMAFIYIQSALSGKQSSSLSDSVTDMLARVFVSGYGSLTNEEKIAFIGSHSSKVREFAHAFEFFILALVVRSIAEISIQPTYSAENVFVTREIKSGKEKTVNARLISDNSRFISDSSRILLDSGFMLSIGKNHNKKLCASDLIKGIISIGFCVIYAVCDELHQLFVDGRGCDINDVICDSVGAFLGVAVVSLICILARNRKTKIQVKS